MPQDTQFLGPPWIVPGSYLEVLWWSGYTRLWPCQSHHLGSVSTFGRCSRPLGDLTSCRISLCELIGAHFSRNVHNTVILEQRADQRAVTSMAALSLHVPVTARNLRAFVRFRRTDHEHDLNDQRNSCTVSRP
jgi:hypothetical protein